MTVTVNDYLRNGVLCTGSPYVISATLNTCISPYSYGCTAFSIFTLSGGAASPGTSPMISQVISPVTSLVSTLDMSLLASPTKSPALYPTYEIYPTRAPTKSPVTSSLAVPTRSPTKATAVPTSLETLGGYYTLATYSDSSCKYLLSSKSFALNVCIVVSQGRYQYITATPSFVSDIAYSDASCMRNGFETRTAYTADACLKSTKVIISPTITVPSMNVTGSIK